jgi:hypothetical protein
LIRTRTKYRITRKDLHKRSRHDRLQRNHVSDQNRDQAGASHA